MKIQRVNKITSYARWCNDERLENKLLILSVKIQPQRCFLFELLD